MEVYIKMEVFEIENGWDLIKVSMTPGGGVYADLPIRYGNRGSEFRETVVLEERGWRFSSIDTECVDYLRNWLTKRIAWLDAQFNPPQIEESTN